MRYTHFPTPWDELRSSQRVRFYTVLSSGVLVALNNWFIIHKEVRY